LNFIVGIKSLDLVILNNVLYKNKNFHVFISYNYKDFLLSIENIKDTISLGDNVIIYNNLPMNSYNDTIKSISDIANIEYFSNWHASNDIDKDSSDAFNDMLIELNESKELSDEEVYEISKYKKENSGITNQMALLQYGIGLPIIEEKGLDQWKAYSSYITASNMVAAKRLINKENTYQRNQHQANGKNPCGNGKHRRKAVIQRQHECQWRSYHPGQRKLRTHHRAKHHHFTRGVISIFSRQRKQLRHGGVRQRGQQHTAGDQR